MLATPYNSLALASRRTTGRRCLAALSRPRLSVANPVSGTFNKPFGFLFNFRSRYSYAIGFGIYLGLRVNDSRIHPALTSEATLELGSGKFQ